MDALTEKEFDIINLIRNNSKNITQRHIARYTGISLGLTNLILKKLIHKGYIKVKCLTHRKINYILTTKGFTEQTQRSYHYVYKTIIEIKNIRKRIELLYTSEYQSGMRKISIIGNNELAELIKLFIGNNTDTMVSYFDNMPDFDNNNEKHLVIDCRNNAGTTYGSQNLKIVNMLDYIANR